MYSDKKKFYQGHHATGRYRHNNDVLRFLADPDVLKQKIENHEFTVYLQAKIDVEGGRMAGAEALIRYRDEMDRSLRRIDLFRCWKIHT